MQLPGAAGGGPTEVRVSSPTTLKQIAIHRESAETPETQSTTRQKGQLSLGRGVQPTGRRAKIGKG